MNRAVGDEGFWDYPLVWLILEKIVLASVVPALVLLAVNPMAFDLKQRISAAIAVVAIGCFVAFTIEKQWGNKPITNQLSSQPSVPAITIEQKATDSPCSNVVGGKNTILDCSPEREKPNAPKRAPTGP
ncbi:MAG: hypothetical protein ABSE56_16855 [Bryobacteraceae bacterium]|jgi:hypothetical protein